jgi:uncharacterized protein (TIGR03118 family)
VFDVQGTHHYAEQGSYTVGVTVTDTFQGGVAADAAFGQTDLVTDNPTVLANLGYPAAAHTDSELVNPWGIAFFPGAPIWVGDNGSGKSTFYDNLGNKAGSVTVPASANAGATNPAPVTGVVINSSATDFLLGGPGSSAAFIFATEDGTISGWNGGASGVLKVDNTNFTSGAVYKGLAIANPGTGNFLYATNFRAGTVDVFNNAFQKVTLGQGGFGTFADPSLPAGYAPFGIQNVGGNLYVTYALQNSSKHDDTAGAGNGFVDVFDPAGDLMQRFASGGALNSPWGVALAPANFGAFSGDLLVGNFGDGHISAFNPTTGAFLGQLTDAAGKPIAIDGLWGLEFGQGGASGNTNTLFFTAGINGENNGLFGSLGVESQGSPASVTDAQLTGAASQSVNVAQNQLFSGVAIAHFTDPGFNPAELDANGLAKDYTATINWGDGGNTSTGIVVPHQTAGAFDGTFTVTGSHTYANTGNFPITVTITHEQLTPVTANGGSATVSATLAGFTYDAASKALTVSGTSVTYSQATTQDATGLHTVYTFMNENGVESFPDTALTSVTLTGQGNSAAATLNTGDTYVGTDGQLHETEESIILGIGGGLVQKVDGQGNAHNFLTMSGFKTVVSNAGKADPGLIVGTSGVANTFVSAGSYAYMNSGSAFYDISGARYVYGLAVNSFDVAYQYDGSGPSAFVVSGTAYSFMIGTDGGKNFFNEAVGFNTNYGVAQHAGQDTAIFYDSPANDVFAVIPPSASQPQEISYMYSDNPDGTLHEFDSAQNFAMVFAYSFVGGHDIAYNNDPAHNTVVGFHAPGT